MLWNNAGYELMPHPLIPISASPGASSGCAGLDLHGDTPLEFSYAVVGSTHCSTRVKVVKLLTTTR